MNRLILYLLLLLPVIASGQKQTVYEVGASTVSIEPGNAVFSLALAGYGYPAEGRFSIAWAETDALPPNALSDDANRWNESAPVPFVSVANVGNQVYALGNDQVLYKKNLAPYNTSWIKAGYNNKETYTIDLKRIAVANDRLYAVGADDKIYMAKHNSQGDLSARSIVVKSGKTMVALVSVDLCGFDYTFTQEIKKEISKKTKIPVEAILINATHTHFAPVPQHYPSWPDFGQQPDPVYLKVVKNGMIASVEKALKNLKKSTISVSRSQSIIGKNRAFSGPDGLYDPSLDVIRFESTDMKTKNVLFINACHPVFRNEGQERYTLSANFPGVAKQIVEEKASIGNAVFFQGCCADINPLKGNYRETGSILANDVVRTLNEPMQPVSGNISFSVDSVLFPVSPWSVEKLKEFRAFNQNKPGDLDAEKNVRWADRILSMYEKNEMPPTMPVYVQTINIGNWKLVGLSREVVTEYSLKIRELWPNQFVSVAAYCNDVASYLPNAAHVRAMNYEGFGSFLWYGQPAFFPENTLEIVIDHIKKQNK